MRQIASTTILTILIINTLLACEPDKPKKIHQIEPFFAADIPYGFNKNKVNFKYDGKWRPRIGKTREQDLSSRIKTKPHALLSYKVPFQKRMSGRKFMVDRIFHFRKEVDKVTKGVNFRSVQPIETLTLTIFFHRTVASGYCIGHSVFTPKKRYHQGPLHQSCDIDHEVWPGAKEDIKRYWHQRTPQDRRRYGTDSPLWD